MKRLRKPPCRSLGDWSAACRTLNGAVSMFSRQSRCGFSISVVYRLLFSKGSRHRLGFSVAHPPQFPGETWVSPIPSAKGGSDD